MTEEKKQTCPACGSSNVVCNNDEDQLICQDCGTIMPNGCSTDTEGEEE